MSSVNASGQNADVAMVPMSVGRLFVCKFGFLHKFGFFDKKLDIFFVCAKLVLSSCE